MCGIFGRLSHNATGTDDRDRLALTAAALAHRGPDHCDVFNDHRVSLVHTRLALVDLDARSDQPFWDAQRRFCLVYNGEIYNFRELRAQLQSQGVTFRTTGDTEVVLESIVRRGLDSTLLDLEGMFAFALYDRQEGSLVLARDRFGMKPLYVKDDDDAFLFASEIGALKPWLQLAPDLPSISAYLQGFGGPTSGFSFFKGITIVPPGTAVVVRTGCRATYRRFWKMHDFLEADEADRLRSLKPAQIVDKVEERLYDSVRMQLLADAPIGVFCSGGVDSSLIAAMAARIHNNIAAFHANVAGPASEVDAATAVARHLALDLNAVDVTEEDTVDGMVDVMQHYAHPFTYHPNSVPFLMVSRLVRSHKVKAVLSGEGADECFVGYPWLIFNLREAVLGSPANLRAAYRLLRSGMRGKPGHRNVATAPADTMTVVRGLHNRFECDIEQDEVRDDLLEKIGRTPSDHDVVTLSQLGYHLRTLLHRNDCLGMATSVESRFPFLDSRLVQLAVNMPYRMKVRFSPATLDSDHWFLRDKWVLRKVAERYLPKALAHRKKCGFPVHHSRRMRITANLFRGSLVADLFSLGPRERDFLIRHADQEFSWKLVHLEVWAKLFLESALPDTVKAWVRTAVTFDGVGSHIRHVVAPKLPQVFLALLSATGTV